MPNNENHPLTILVLYAEKRVTNKILLVTLFFFGQKRTIRPTGARQVASERYQGHPRVLQRTISSLKARHPISECTVRGILVLQFGEFSDVAPPKYWVLSLNHG